MATIADLSDEAYLVLALEKLSDAQQRVQRIRVLIESKKPAEPANTDTVVSIEAMASNANPDYAMQIIVDREAEKQRLEDTLDLKAQLRAVNEE